MGISIAAPSQRMSVDAGRFGAKFDGTTDDTAAIQAAIDAVFAAGWGIVDLPRGNAVVSGLVLKFGVRLRGRGMRQTTLTLKAASNQHVIRADVSTDVGVTDPNAQWLGIEDLQIDANKAAQTTGTCHGIFLSIDPLAPVSKPAADDSYDSHHLIRNVRVMNARNTGVWIEGRSQTRVENVVSYLSGDHGFRVGTDTHYRDCLASSSGLQGFFMSGVSSFSLTGCKAIFSGQTTPASGFGFACSGAQAGSLSGCIAQDNRGGGFQFASVTRGVTCVGAVADSNSTSAAGTYPGFDLSDASNCVIVGVASERVVPGTQRNAVKIATNSAYNVVSLRHQFLNGATTGIAIGAAVDDPTNIVDINGLRADGVETVTYAASITPDPFLGAVKKITLTGNLTVNAPTGTNFAQGARMTFIVVQDATGGRTVTWNAAFKTNWVPDTSANKVNSITFVYDGTNWQEVSASFTPPSASGISASTLTTKGDLISATAASTPVRVGVGADGTVLSAASAQASGLLWKEVSPGTFSVTDYGAAGDGTTDDTAAINAAVDAMEAAGGGVVWFDGRKTYRTTGNGIVLSANVKSKLAGNGAKIRPDSGAIGIWVDSLASGFDARQVEIENFDLRGVTDTGEGIRIRDTDGVLVRNVYVKDFQYGIRIQSFAAGRYSERCVIRDSYFEGCVYGAALEKVSGTGSFDETWFRNCGFSGCSTHGAWLGTGVTCHRGGFGDCTFWGSNVTLLKIQSSMSGTVVRAAFESTTGGTTTIGIDFTGATNTDQAIFELQNFTGAGVFSSKVTGFTGSWREGRFNRATASGVYFDLRGESENQSRWAIRRSGSSALMEWGDGTLTPDANLYRGGADQVKSDDLIYGAGGLATFQVAGAVSDASFAQTPPNGAIAVDSTNSKLYVRVAGVWKSVTVA